MMLLGIFVDSCLCISCFFPASGTWTLDEIVVIQVKVDSFFATVTYPCVGCGIHVVADVDGCWINVDCVDCLATELDDWTISTLGLLVVQFCKYNNDTEL